MGATTNGDILAALASFQKESGQQREAIMSGINELDKKLGYTNGKVAELYRDVRGDDRGFTGLAKEVSTIKTKLYIYSGGLAVVVFLIEVASHLYK